MNTTFLVPFFLGTFSGFLATLPIGPAKILAVRKFLLVSKGDETEIQTLKSSNAILLASIGGLIVAHFLFFLSIQFPFLYSLWVQPHTLTFIFIAVLFFYLYQLKNIQFNIYSTQSFLKSNSDFHEQQAAFLETLMFQILNPVILPNPIFSRLTNVFLFRYSTLSTFLVGNLLGLLSGYAAFYVSTLFLLKKLEFDAPTIYRLVKIKIHQIFGIILVIFSFLCFNRIPLPALKPFVLKDTSDQFSLKKPLSDNIWPDSFFGYERWKRPFRLLDYDDKKFPQNETIKPFNKMFFSQFFFEGKIKDGKFQLIHNFPKTLSIVNQNINLTLSKFENDSKVKPLETFKNVDLINNWVYQKKNRRFEINQDIENKINQIQNGNILENLSDKKLSSVDNNGNKISKQRDPRLNVDSRESYQSLKRKSFLFLTKENFQKNDFANLREKKNIKNLYTKNKLKLFLSQYTQNSSENFLLTWEPINKEFGQIQQNFEENKLTNQDGTSIDSTFKSTKQTKELRDFYGKFSKKFHNIVDFSTQRNEKEFSKQNFPGVDPKLIKFQKFFPIWNINLSKQYLEKLKVELSAKRQHHLTRFFPRQDLPEDRQNFVPPSKPFFRRHEFPGTIIARRTKALCWNGFQKKPHSPFFLEKNTLLKKSFLKKEKLQAKQGTVIRQGQLTSRLFQYLRDYILSLQAYIRKYIKLPLLIFLKNIARQLCLQSPEWEKDWKELSEEIYIDCNFYGKAGSVGVKLPNFFTSDGMKQIKIIKPFQLRFWTRSKKIALDDSENYSFLTVWGQETRVPFGTVKKSPSFWKILMERLKLILQYKILKNRSSLSIDRQKKQNLIQENANSKYKNQNPVVEVDFQGSQQTQIKNEVSEKIKTYKKNQRDFIDNSDRLNQLSQTSKKEKISRQRDYTHENIFVFLQKRWFFTYRFFLKKQKQFFFGIQRKFFDFKKLILQQNTKILKNCIKIFSLISRFLRLAYFQFSEFYNYFLINFKKYNKSSPVNVQIFDIFSTKNLSQASIVHNIWEDRLFNRPNVTSLMDIWNQKNPLAKTTETFFKKQGILDSSKSDYLIKEQWKEWLKGLNGYTPTLKLWEKISPIFWTEAVEKYWKELPSSNLKEIFISQHTNFSKKDDLNQLFEKRLVNNFLEFHLPLFKASQKQKKLWKLNIITDRFTQIGNESDVHSFYSWNQSKFNNKTNYLIDTNKKGKRKTETVGYSSTLDFATSNFKENNFRKNLLQKDCIKELPIIKREKDRPNFAFKLQTLKQRESFFPVSIRRWKLKKVKNKLRQLAKNVLKKPQGSESSSFSFGEKNRKLLRELFQSKDMLFSDILENWNSKILDDELLFYNTISAILRFENKNNISLFSTNSSFPFENQRSTRWDSFFVLLEEFYSPSHLREKRILDCLNFDSEFEKNTNLLKNNEINSNLPKDISKVKQKNFDIKKVNNEFVLLQKNQENIQQKQSIVRFLWPTHRLEDLSCMNRFWLGTANQSRFSMLRIQTFPNV